MLKQPSNSKGARERTAGRLVHQPSGIPSSGLWAYTVALTLTTPVRVRGRFPASKPPHSTCPVGSVFLHRDFSQLVRVDFYPSFRQWEIYTEGWPKCKQPRCWQAPGDPPPLPLASGQPVPRGPALVGEVRGRRCGVPPRGARRAGLYWEVSKVSPPPFLPSDRSLATGPPASARPSPPPTTPGAPKTGFPTLALLTNTNANTSNKLVCTFLDQGLRLCGICTQVPI